MIHPNVVEYNFFIRICHSSSELVIYTTLMALLSLIIVLIIHGLAKKQRVAEGVSSDEKLS